MAPRKQQSAADAAKEKDDAAESNQAAEQQLEQPQPGAEQQSAESTAADSGADAAASADGAGDGDGSADPELIQGRVLVDCVIGGQPLKINSIAEGPSELLEQYSGSAVDLNQDAVAAAARAGGLVVPVPAPVDVEE